MMRRLRAKIHRRHSEGLARLKLASADRGGSVGQSATLGEYVEFREGMLPALWFLIPLSTAIGFFVWQMGIAGPYDYCGRFCQHVSASANRQGAGIMVFFLVAIGFLYLLLKLRRWPALRVGELGIEDRTQLLGCIRVGWQDVLTIPASEARPLTRSVDIRVRAKSGLGGIRGWVRIRTGGLSATPTEVEACMDAAYRAFHGLHPRTYEPRVASNRRVLKGITVQTAKYDWTEVTQADLHHLIDRNDLHDFLTVLSTARGSEHFIQARRIDSDVWVLEHQDGSADRLLTANCMTNIEVFDAFMAWIKRDDPVLHRLLEWHAVAGDK